MKKIILKGLLFVSLFLFCLSLTGCGETKDKKDDSEEPKQEDKKETGDIKEIKNWVLDTVGRYITDDIELPTTHPTLGGEITWSSTDDYMDDEGHIIERAKKAVTNEYAFIINYNGQLDSDYITINISPITLEEAMDRFESSLPSRMVKDEKIYFITRDIDIPQDYFGVIQVSMESSNKDLFTNEGKYIKPLEDTETTIKVEISDSYRTISKEFDMVVYGKTALEIIEEGVDWINNNFVDMLLTAETGLPTETGNGCKITWKSSNANIVTAEGKVIEAPYERYVSLTAKLTYDKDSKTKDYYCKVKAMDTSKMTIDQKLEAYLNSLGPTELAKMSFEGGYGTNITQSNGILCFFGDTCEPDITRAIIATNLGNKPNEDRVSTNFICVHDTGNANAGADAAMHSRYINNGSGGAQTSWHFSVGDDAIYQQVEDTEITWHAGDGSRTFKLIDTGVKATMGMPLMTFSNDGYFVLGGQKTNIRIPSDTVNKRTGPYGIYTTVGANGNYWMNNAYYNSGYGWICNQGGNRNSISMETCIDSGSDYVKTFYNIARLVAYLLIKYDMSPDQVLQHNNFSGKDCPTVIRATGHWAELKDLIATIKYGFDTFKDYKFEWTSKNLNKLDKYGVVTLNANVGDILEYSVKVTKNEVTVAEKSFSTTLVKK